MGALGVTSTPATRVSRRVETSEYENVFTIDKVEQAIGKSAEKCATESSVHDRKGPGVSRNYSNACID